MDRSATGRGENEYTSTKPRAIREVLEGVSLGRHTGVGRVGGARFLRRESVASIREAAGYGVLRQREDAIKRLAKPEENVARVKIEASELEPQVRRMERPASRRG